MKNKKIILVIGIIIVVMAALVGVTIWQISQPTPSPAETTTKEYKLDHIKEVAKSIDYNQYNLDKIIPADAKTGNLPENIEGKSSAPVIIYEYADYQCSYCAALNTYLNQIVKDYDGKVAVVFRSYALPYHPNAVAASSAANAAAIQGYWEKYKDLLFANQNDWFESTGETLQAHLEQYFRSVAGEKADLEKFRADMQSDAVEQKVAFDYGAGEKEEIGGTPWLFMDGEWIDHEGAAPKDYAEKIRKLIDQKLQKLEQKK